LQQSTLAAIIICVKWVGFVLIPGTVILATPQALMTLIIKITVTLTDRLRVVFHKKTKKLSL
jgi:hypothetical protein